MLHELGSIIEVTGPIVAWLTAAFLVYDRLIRGRPIVSLTARNKPLREARFLTITNPGDVDIAIREIVVEPKVYTISKGSRLDDVVEAVVGDEVRCLIEPGGSVELPLFIRDAKLEKEIKSPVRIIIRWRKTKSMWLPQVPVGIWVSTAAMRELTGAV